MTVHVISRVMAESLVKGLKNFTDNNDGINRIELDFIDGDDDTGLIKDIDISGRATTEVKEY